MVGISKKQFKTVMRKRECAQSQRWKLVLLEILLFVNEQTLGETNINDEDIPITPNMLATGRPLRLLLTPSSAIIESINPDKMW